jgi:uncharacterized membrane protein
MHQSVVKRRILHRLFEIGVIIKGIDGCFELIGGLLLLSISTQRLSDIVIFLTQHELSDDPSDVFANALFIFASHLQVGTKVFGSIYLLSHGVLKIFLVYHLLKERMWVFPLAIGVMEVFVLYQTYRLHSHPSIGLAFVSLIDMLVILFVWSEWKAREALFNSRLVSSTLALHD